MPIVPTGLSPRQTRFVHEFMVDLNATQAAIRAGYSPKTAGKAGPRLAQSERVKAEIDKAKAKVAEKLGISADRVLRELAKIAFTDLTEVVSWGQKEVAFGYDADGMRLSPDQLGDAVLVRREMAPFVEARDSESLPAHARSAVSEVSLTKDGLRIKMHDKVTALNHLGRAIGMFKTEITGPDGGPIEVDIAAVTTRDRAKAMAALLVKQALPAPE